MYENLDNTPAQKPQLLSWEQGTSAMEGDQPTLMNCVHRYDLKGNYRTQLVGRRIANFVIRKPTAKIPHV